MIGTRHQVLLAAVLALALFHALAHARVRPMYQASDEMNYIFAAQFLAGTLRDDVERTCLYPPDGERFHLPAGAGKPGFRHVTARQLAILCEWQPEAFPLFALRALQAMSLPVVAWAAWYLGRLITGCAGVGIVAALLVALQPVAATQSGAVSPDAWANAWSALALVAGARLALDVHRWWDLPVLVLTTVAALLWKDTTNFLLLHLGLVLLLGAYRAVSAGRVERSAVHRRADWAAVAVLGLGGVLVWQLSQSLVSPYLLGYDAAGAISHAPALFASRVLQDALTGATGMLSSSVTAIGSFGASTLAMPFSASLVALATVAAGIVGLLVEASRTSLGVGRRGLAAIWTLSAVGCLLQPSVRQVLLGTSDMHQGRWLLPMLAPAAACLAVGLSTWLPRWSSIQPVLLLWMAALGLTWMSTVAHFYETFPDVLRRSGLFLRSTGGDIVDDVRVLKAVEQTMAAQSALVTWGILVGLLAAALVVYIGVVRLAARRDCI